MNAGFSPRGEEFSRIAFSAAARWLEVKCHFPNPFSILEEAFRYIFVIVKFPDPVHPPVPVKVHVPVTVLLFTVPCRVSVLPLGVPDVMVNWKAPVILPLKFPLRTNDPVWDPPEVKQAVDVVKLRLVPVTTTVPLPCVSDVVNAKAGVPSVFVSVAVQFPATVFALLEFPPPHATSIRPSARTMAIPNCFMATPQFIPLYLWNPWHSQKLRHHEGKKLGRANRSCLVFRERLAEIPPRKVGCLSQPQQQRPATGLGVSHHKLIADS